MADHKRTVLVCDNDEKLLASIQSGLAEHNFDVHVMTSPDELVEHAERNHAALVIVNPELPGFNAPDTCKYLKNQQGIPVLLMVDRQATTRITLDGCNADGIFTKPPKISDLANMVERQLVLSQS
jgi:DNA-binding response OmpR family regulator